MITPTIPPGVPPAPAPLNPDVVLEYRRQRAAALERLEMLRTALAYADPDEVDSSDDLADYRRLKAFVGMPFGAWLIAQGRA